MAEIETEGEETKEEVRVRIIEFFNEIFKEMVIEPEDLVKTGEVEFEEEDGLRRISGSFKARKVIEATIKVRIE